MVKKLPAFYWAQRLITTHTAARATDRWTQSMSSHSTCIRCILISYSHLRPYHTMSPQHNPVHISLLFPTCHMPHSHLPPWFHHMNNICWGTNILKPFITQISHLLSAPPSWTNRSSSTPYSKTPSTCVLPIMQQDKLHIHINNLHITLNLIPQTSILQHFSLSVSTYTTWCNKTYVNQRETN